MILSDEKFRTRFLRNIKGAADYEDFKEVILSAQAELESETQVFFEPRKIVGEAHDYFLEDFRQTFWLQQFYHWPVVSLEKAEMYYNQRRIAVLDLDWLVIEKQMGTLEFMPSALGESGLMFQALALGLSGIDVAFGVSYDRIPLFFRVDYTAGLDFTKLPATEQAEVRMAIGRRAAINVLPVLDDKVGISSESMSQEGVSESVSYTSGATHGRYSHQIEQYKKDEEKWIERFTRKHCRGMAFTIA